MTNKEKFLSLVSPASDETLESIRFRNTNKEWLRESKRIAFKILKTLKAKGMSQKELAEQMGVSPQYVNKLVKGKENFTLETLAKLQNTLNIPLLASYYEEQRDNSENKNHSVQMFSYKSAYQQVAYSDFNLTQKKAVGS